MLRQPCIYIGFTLSLIVAFVAYYVTVSFRMTSAPSTIFTTTIESPRVAQSVTCGHCNAEITGGSSSNPCIKACKGFRALLPRISSVSS